MSTLSFPRLFLVLVISASVLAGAAEKSPRQRVSLNEGWRFIKGDPAGNTVDLRYDVRPELEDTRDDKAADSRPEEAVKIDGNGANVLKPWILPSANAFIKDAAQRHVRPPGNPGGDVAYVQPGFDDSSWRLLDLPHDWGIEGPFITEGNFGGMGRLPSWGVAWYRKKLEISKDDATQSVILEIDGAMAYATVWLNGKLVGGWPFGYSSWQLDLTPYVNFGGDNQLAIRLDNPPSSSRWYPGGGIYRNVWLTTTSPVRVAQWGTFVTTPEVSTEAATVALEVKVQNTTSRTTEVTVDTAIYPMGEAGQRRDSAVAQYPSASVKVNAGDTTTHRASVRVTNPRLWGPLPDQTPHRYVAVTTLKQGGAVIDRYETAFGIRTVTIDAEKGLQVNGKNVPLFGVNMHHDLGALGAAWNLRAAERQLEMLAEMGCNAIRISHNPPAPELLDLTDRMGFLVMNETFDCWERKKTPLDFHLIFPEWSEPDTRALILRDRNHPSVIIWSIGNEVGEQYTDAAGAEVAKRLYAFVKEEDPTRPITAAMNWAKSDMPLPATLDIIGLNYQGEGIRQDPEFEGTERIRTPPQYPNFRKAFPNKPIISTETASAFSSRGVYLFPVSPTESAPVRDGRGGDSKNHHVSAYELHAVDFGSSAEKVFRSLEQHPFVIGQFVWTGWDHLGEPTPYYAARSSYSGIIDLAGFKKDRFWLYQSQWRKDLPMAHLLPHWTWPERVGEVTPIHVFTSGDAAEVFLNGRSLGRKSMQSFQYRLRWDEVKYEPGVVEVVAYKDGKEWARDRVETAGEAAKIETTVDRDVIHADGVDLAFITVRITDAQGRTAPRANSPITFAVEGAGELVATDNGDQTSFEPFQSAHRSAFNGYALAIVRAKKGQVGAIKVSARAPGLQTGAVNLEAKRQN